MYAWELPELYYVVEISLQTVCGEFVKSKDLIKTPKKWYLSDFKVYIVD